MVLATFICLNYRLGKKVWIIRNCLLYFDFIRAVQHDFGVQSSRKGIPYEIHLLGSNPTVYGYGATGQAVAMDQLQNRPFFPENLYRVT